MTFLLPRLRYSLLISSVLLLAGCTAQSPASTVPDPAPTGQSSVPAPSGARTVRIEASDFIFTPSTVQVKTGEDVIFEITSTQGDHAFSIPDLGMDFQPVPNGQTIAIRIPTEKSGVYQMVCGPMHPTMLGTLVIQ